MLFRLHNPARMFSVLMTAALWGTSLYLAHLSGRAMNDSVGRTIESQDLDALSGVIGLPALLMLGLLVGQYQSGGLLIRFIKAGFTVAVAFVFWVIACYALQSLASP